MLPTLTASHLLSTEMRHEINCPLNWCSLFDLWLKFNEHCSFFTRKKKALLQNISQTRLEKSSLSVVPAPFLLASSGITSEKDLGLHHVLWTEPLLNSLSSWMRLCFVPSLIIRVHIGRLRLQSTHFVVSIVWYCSHNTIFPPARSLRRIAQCKNLDSCEYCECQSEVAAASPLLRWYFSQQDSLQSACVHSSVHVRSKSLTACLSKAVYMISHWEPNAVKSWLVGSSIQYFCKKLFFRSHWETD